MTNSSKKQFDSLSARSLLVGSADCYFPSSEKSYLNSSVLHSALCPASKPLLGFTDKMLVTACIKLAESAQRKEGHTRPTCATPNMPFLSPVGPPASFCGPTNTLQ